MNKRSPILGFNHNFKHRGLVFHVQTEDSGVRNPHIFTHLYYGGVILSTRKLDYDAEADDEVVKSLMQAQHKAVLKDLKGGAFDAKIDAYLGDTPGLEARKPALAEAGSPSGKGKGRERHDTMVSPPPEFSHEAGAPAEPGAASSGSRRPDSEVSAAFRAISADDSVQLVQEEGDGAGEDEPAFIRDAAPPSAPEPPGAQPSPPGSYSHIRARRESGSGVPREPLDENESSGTYSQVRPGRRDESGSYPHLASSGVPKQSADDTGSGAYHQVRTGRRDQLEGAAPSAVQDYRGAATIPDIGAEDLPERLAPKAAQGRPPPVPDDARAPTTPPGGRPTGKRRRASETAPAAAASPAAQPSGKQRPVSGRTQKGAPGSPVVSRPAVIVGAPPKVVGGAPRREAKAKGKSAGGRRAQPRRAREDGGATGLFGKDLISEKSLDEVILAYLSDDSGEEG